MNITITIKAHNLGTNGIASDATGRIELPREWYDAVKYDNRRPTSGPNADEPFTALGRAVFKTLQAIESAALVRTIYVDGQPVV